MVRGVWVFLLRSLSMATPFREFHRIPFLILSQLKTLHFPLQKVTLLPANNTASDAKSGCLLNKPLSRFG